MSSRAPVKLIAAIMFAMALGQLFFESPANIGVRTETINGHSTFDAASNPIALIVSLVLAGAYMWILQVDSGSERQYVTAGLWRRLGAFLVDFILAMLIFSPWLSLMVLLIESSNTGIFTWSVHRDYLENGDTLLTLVCVAVGFLFCLAYFSIPVYFVRQSPGAALLGIGLRYAPQKAPSFWRAIGRVVLGYIAICGWIFSIPLALKDPEKKMWHDVAAGTRVVKWV
jgi:uncharacterized RDD family membrane protein YckC